MIVVVMADRAKFGLVNEKDTCTDDLFQLFEHPDLKDAVMLGHSIGGGEVASFVGRHGASRVSKAVLISSVPLMLKTATNSGGLPIDVFDGFQAAMLRDRAQFFLDGGRETGEFIIDNCVELPDQVLHTFPPARSSLEDLCNRAIAGNLHRYAK